MSLGQVVAAMVTLTKRYPVTIDQLLEIQRRRAAFRNGRWHRRRARARTLAANGGRPARKKRVNFGGKVVYAGEGEFHALLRELGWNEQKFADFAGVAVKTVHSWEGHPIALWPVQLLYYTLWAKNMAAVIGHLAEKYRPRGVPPAPGGRYPRTREQGKKLLESVGGQRAA